MPRQNKADRDVCRLAIGPKGLRAWPTKAHEITPDDGPGVTLATNVAKCSEEIVFGTERCRLIDTLLTMQNHGLSMQVPSPSTAICIAGNGGDERFLIMPSRL